jgi:uncharacterized protein YjhX (UPF0386 family)
MLTEILAERRGTIDWRVKAGRATETQARLMTEILGRLQIWVVVTSNEDRNLVQAALSGTPYPVEVFSLDNVRAELENLGRIGA